MKATEHYFPVVLFILLNNSVRINESRTNVLTKSTHGISSGSTSASMFIDSVLALAVGAAARRILSRAIWKKNKILWILLMCKAGFRDHTNLVFWRSTQFCLLNLLYSRRSRCCRSCRFVRSLFTQNEVRGFQVSLIHRSCFEQFSAARFLASEGRDSLYLSAWIWNMREQTFP